jgi:hypothetical protein
MSDLHFGVVGGVSKLYTTKIGHLTDHPLHQSLIGLQGTFCP